LPEGALTVAQRHLIGLLLGTEDDWPTAFEHFAARLGPVTYRGETHELATERITNEPFDLRYKPRHSLVIDRLAWWYDLPREWLKKISLMDDVYLLNNPFTFQAMEKHAAYCAMMRLGFRIPSTWLLPHKVPPSGGKWAAATAKFEEMASRYNPPFDLGWIAEQVGYPLYMKPFDGGQWIGVTRIRNAEELQAGYDGSGERLMHLQAALDPFDVFVRSLSIGAETMSMFYDPDRPLHDRYQVRHDFLAPEVGYEILTFSRLVNAFFRWEFNSAETIVRGGAVHPIDYANASPDVALTSLHYYFPWAIKALVKWSAFCVVTERPMRINQDFRDYFQVADRDDLSYEDKVREYRRLADEYFQVEAYEDFCAEALPHADETMAEYVASDDFDRLLVQTVASTFPQHEHEHFTAHYRELLGGWLRDQERGGRPPEQATSVG
jgi:hypothetical protein